MVKHDINIPLLTLKHLQSHIQSKYAKFYFYKNSSGDEISNVNIFTMISHT